MKMYDIVEQNLDIFSPKMQEAFGADRSTVESSFRIAEIFLISDATLNNMDKTSLMDDKSLEKSSHLIKLPHYITWLEISLKDRKKTWHGGEGLCCLV